MRVRVRRISVVLVLIVPMVAMAGGTAHAAASTMTITPNTGLIDGQSVHVVVTGLAPNATAGIEQCLSNHLISGCDGSTLRYLATDAQGGFTLDVPLRTVLHTPDGTFDCRTSVDPCVLGANTSVQAEGAAFATLGFDPSGPLLPPPAFHATPATGLVDHQTVTIDGTGFTPDLYIELRQCIAGATDIADCHSSYAISPPVTDATGNLHGSFTVRSLLATDGGPVVDCRAAPNTCELQAGRFYQGLDTVAAAISFDPDAPADPPASLAVAPSTDLVDGQIVHVDGANFAPTSGVNVTECASTSTVSTCSYGAFGETDSAGAISLDIEVRTRLWAGQILDCRDPATTCTLQASSYTDYDSHPVAPLSFRVDGPLLPLPSVEATPHTDLLDGDIVSVTGVGFPIPPSIPLSVPLAGASPLRAAAPASARWVPPATLPANAVPLQTGPTSSIGNVGAEAEYEIPVLECATGSDLYQACSRFYIYAGLDDDGNLSGQMQVLATFSALDGTPVDCRTAVDACELRTGYDPLGSATTPLSFDPNGALAAPPALTLTPDSGLSDGTVMHVVGDGFPPDATVSLHHCQAGTTGFSSCDENLFGFAQTDHDGRLDFTTTAKAVLDYGVTFLPDHTTAASTFDCRSRADACRLMIVDDLPENRWPSVTLDYTVVAADPTTPPPPATAPLATTATPQFTG